MGEEIQRDPQTAKLLENFQKKFQIKFGTDFTCNPQDISEPNYMHPCMYAVKVTRKYSGEPFTAKRLVEIGFKERELIEVPVKNLYVPRATMFERFRQVWNAERGEFTALTEEYLKEKKENMLTGAQAIADLTNTIREKRDPAENRPADEPAPLWEFSKVRLFCPVREDGGMLIVNINPGFSDWELKKLFPDQHDSPVKEELSNQVMIFIPTQTMRHVLGPLRIKLS